MGKNQGSTLDVGNLLDKEDIKALTDFVQIKRDIATYFDMELFTDKMKEIIEKSEVFEFRSRNAKKSINSKSPVFILKIKDNNIYNELLSYSDTKEQIDKVNKIIFKEILDNMSRFITECIMEEEKTSELFVDLPDDLKTFFITNIYSTKSNIEGNNIQISYFI
ncbi:hypothetical protein Bp8pS_266 [Bacillus phage vB_BpuM-BpSp]|nr:hypothetical protein Bp8pS_266 [Bacillus phage vB_BpuM-BpSp]